MNMVKSLLLTTLVYICASFAMAAEQLDLQTYQSRAEYLDVRQNLIDAIINRGFVIDFNGRVGDMLKRTRPDIGGKSLYSDAEYLIFCSAIMSRKTMETDIHNIGYCPYVITVYESNANPGTIYVSFRRLTSSDNTDHSLAAVQKMLDEIAREAVE